MARIRLTRTCDVLLATVVCISLGYVVYNKLTDALARIQQQETSPRRTSRDASLIASSSSEDRELQANSFYLIGQKAKEAGTGSLNRGKKVNLCPEDPPVLVGELACTCDPVTPKDLISLYPFMELGGRLRPSHCLPLERVAVVIPVRKDTRDSVNGLILINMLVPILQRQMVDVTFLVIEQTNDTSFNPGALNNIGYLEAMKISDNFDCFIFHAAHLVPLNDHHLYRCSDNPGLFTTKIEVNTDNVQMEKYEQEDNLGVMAVKRYQFLRMNGFSNLYFGSDLRELGADFSQRIRNINLTSDRADPAVAHYRQLPLAANQGQQLSSQGLEVLKKTSRQWQFTEGVSSVRYRVTGLELTQLLTRVTVSLNQTNIVQNSHLQKDLEKHIV